MENVSFPDTLKTMGKNAFKGNSLTEITLPKAISSVPGDVFQNNPQLNVFYVKQYRAQPSDDKYILSPSSVKGNAPWGAGSNASVFFMDEPQPSATTTVTPDVSNNQVIVDISSLMNTISCSIKEYKQNSGMPELTNQSIAAMNWNTTPSTAKMTIPASSGNGTYSFTLVWYDKADTSNATPKNTVFSFVIDDFCTVNYDVNGDIAGTGSADETVINGYDSWQLNSTVKPKHANVDGKKGCFYWLEQYSLQ